MIRDPVPVIQRTLLAYLSKEAQGPVIIDGTIAADVPWRPHVFQTVERTGWQVLSKPPESVFWEKRIRVARGANAALQIGIAATEEVFRSEGFLLTCYELNAKLLLIAEHTDEFTVEEFYAAAPDFIYQRGIRLDKQLARSLLDRALDRALQETDKNRKGVLLEVVIALFLSQVDNYEVTAKGISNRSQQMDVLVHNRGVSGVLGSSPIVLAEAKNWKAKVAPKEYWAFYRKLSTRNGRAKLGFLVTTGQFTAGVALEARRDSKEDIVVVMIEGKALPQIWRSSTSITREVEALAIKATVGH